MNCALFSLKDGSRMIAVVAVGELPPPSRALAFHPRNVGITLDGEPDRNLAAEPAPDFDAIQRVNW